MPDKQNSQNEQSDSGWLLNLSTEYDNMQPGQLVAEDEDVETLSPEPNNIFNLASQVSDDGQIIEEESQELVVPEQIVPEQAPLEQASSQIPTDNADAILNTALQNPESIEETIANVTSSVPKQFDQKQFESNLNTIASQTAENLKKYYKTNDVRVVLRDSGIRSVETQQEYLNQGASWTPLSLHNFGAGGDYDIYIDGKKILADRGFSKDLERSVEPYQILGGVAKKYGYFWGWGNDPGHVASHRFVDQLMKDYPELADTDTAKGFYEKHLEKAPLAMKPLLSTLDNIYGQEVNREYTGDDRTLDPLLNPIEVQEEPVQEKIAETDTQLKTDDAIKALSEEFERFKTSSSDAYYASFFPPVKNPQILHKDKALVEVEKQIYGMLESGNNDDLQAISQVAGGLDAENIKLLAQRMLESPFVGDLSLAKNMGIKVPEWFTDPISTEEANKVGSWAGFFARGYNSFHQAATMGYTRVQPQLPATSHSETIADVAGGFFGMLIPFNYMMKGGAIATGLVIDAGRKMSMLDSVFKFMSKNPKIANVSTGWASNIIGFNLHAQADANMIGVDFKDRLHAIKESTWHATLFSSVGAMKELGKLTRLEKAAKYSSYPALGFLGYAMVPDIEDHPDWDSWDDETKARQKSLNNTQKLSSGAMLVSYSAMHGGLGERTQKLRNYFNSVLPSSFTKANPNAVNNMILETLKAVRSHPSKEKIILEMAKGEGQVEMFKKPELAELESKLNNMNPKDFKEVNKVFSELESIKESTRETITEPVGDNISKKGKDFKEFASERRKKVKPEEKTEGDKLQEEIDKLDMEIAKLGEKIAETNIEQANKKEKEAKNRDKNKKYNEEDLENAFIAQDYNKANEILKSMIPDGNYELAKNKINEVATKLKSNTVVDGKTQIKTREERSRVNIFANAVDNLFRGENKGAIVSLNKLGISVQSKGDKVETKWKGARDPRHSKAVLEKALEGVNEPEAKYRFDKTIEDIKTNTKRYRWDQIVKLAKERGIYNGEAISRGELVDKLVDSYKKPKNPKQKAGTTIVIDGLKISYDSVGKMRISNFGMPELRRIAKKLGIKKGFKQRDRLIDAIMRADYKGKAVKDPMPAGEETVYNNIGKNIKEWQAQLKLVKDPKSTDAQIIKSNIRKANELKKALEEKYTLPEGSAKVSLFPGVELVYDWLYQRSSQRKARQILSADEVDALHSLMTGKNITPETLIIANEALKNKEPSQKTIKLGLRRVYEEIHKFFNPLRDMPKEIRDEFLEARYKFAGQRWLISNGLTDLVQQFEGYTKLERVQSWQALHGDIPIENIKNTKLRKLTQEVRDAFDGAGQALVDRGLMSQEAYDGLKGEYLVRLYYRYVLEKGASIGGRSKMDLSYHWQRKELDAATKATLGEVITPELPIKVGLMRELGDIAKYDYFASILGNPNFTYQPSIVEIPRAPGSKETKKLGIGEAVRELEVSKKMLEYADELQEPYIRKHIEELTNAIQTSSSLLGKTPEDFKQIPVHEGYGLLSGVYVRKSIHDDIVSMFQLTEKSDYRSYQESVHSLEKRVTAFWKTGKVAFNPPTILRNTFSNPWQLSMSGMAYHDIPRFMVSAAYKMAKKDGDWLSAGKSGVFSGTWSEAEIQEILKRTQEMEKEFAKTGDWWGAVQSFGSKIAGGYGKIDEFYKFTKYLHSKNQGKTDLEASMQAQKWVMDYSLVSPMTRVLRENWYGIPFITYQQKVLPLIAEAAWHRPTTLILPFALTAAITKRYIDNGEFTEEEFGKLKVAMGNEMANSNSLLIIPRLDGSGKPLYDKKGRLQAINLEYALPWSFWHETVNNVYSGDFAAIRNNMGLMPTAMISSALFTGVVPTMDGGLIELWNVNSTVKEKTAAFAEFVYNLAVPGIMNTHGAIANMLTNKGPMQVETTDVQDWSKFSGFTIKPIDIPKGMDKAMRLQNYYLRKLDEEYARKFKKLPRIDKAGKIDLNTEEYKSLHAEKIEKALDIYKKYFGPLVTNKVNPETGKNFTLGELMDKPKESIIELLK